MGVIRVTRQQTQVAVAGQMHMLQSAVSRFESQSDCLLSTLRKCVNALGGTLEMRAVFPDGVIELDRLMKTPAVQERYAVNRGSEMRSFLRRPFMIMCVPNSREEYAW